MFMFLTRSYDEGFRVFTGSGAKAEEKDAKDFDTAMTYSGVKDSPVSCAVMFRRGGKVYVLARSMDTGRKDKNTRSILFTFCVVLDERERDSARRIFSHLAGNWRECEAFMRECLGEKFRHEKFVAFLENYPINVEMPSKNYVLRSSGNSAPELNYVRPSGMKRHIRFAALYMAVIAVVVYVTAGLNYEHNIKHFVDDATTYADGAGEKLKVVGAELESLSADLHAKVADVHAKVADLHAKVAEAQAKLAELQSAERELAGLYAEAQSADEELELSYLRIRSMENADSSEAEYLAKSSGEAADRAGEFSLSVREKLRSLREKLGM